MARSFRFRGETKTLDNTARAAAYTSLARAPGIMAPAAASWA